MNLPSQKKTLDFPVHDVKFTLPTGVIPPRRARDVAAPERKRVHWRRSSLPGRKINIYIYILYYNSIIYHRYLDIYHNIIIYIIPSSQLR